MDDKTVISVSAVGPGMQIQGQSCKKLDECFITAATGVKVNQQKVRTVLLFACPYHYSDALMNPMAS